MRTLAGAIFLFLATPLVAQSIVCAPCHAKIWESYRPTGMARSFYRPRPENTVENYTTHNSYDHAASGIRFTMIRRDGRYFQRQAQIGPGGAEIDPVDREIDFVLGSGNHSRTYLHRGAGNTLVQMPLAWYSEKGGYWAMSPGYDAPDHQDDRRAVTYDCMFCHNAYPKIPEANQAPRSSPAFLEIPEGIDCQRCHGDGEQHISLARSGASPDSIRAAIVNPSRLPPARRAEVCEQCHLETTSSPLPGSIVRYERGPFSYRPGEPLADFILHFDHAPNRGYDDKFEISSSVYRLRKSACFRATKGALTCTTCHDPHQAVQDAAHFTSVCRQCHAATLDTLIAAGRHTNSADCTGCHMPKRRASDVVHAVMTDHWIQRRKPEADLTAAIPERRPADYRGAVVPYDPLTKPEDELYLAVAQVTENSNLNAGIPRLAAAIQKFRPANAEYYLQLADALSSAGRQTEAGTIYAGAVARAPRFAAALERLAINQSSLHQSAEAEATLRQALAIQPADAALWIQLGLAQLGENQPRDAIASFEKASQLDPEMTEAYNTAGAIEYELGDTARAEVALRQAIRMEPNFAPAHDNLGNLLAETRRFAEAENHFQAALKYRENYAAARYNYALALNGAGRPHDAQLQIEAFLRTDPSSAQAHEFLGNLLLAQHDQTRAIAEFREALRLAPSFARADLDLGRALAASGDTAAALPFLQKAAAGSDPAARDQARQLLDSLMKQPR